MKSIIRTSLFALLCATICAIIGAYMFKSFWVSGVLIGGLTGVVMYKIWELAYDICNSVIDMYVSIPNRIKLRRFMIGFRINTKFFFLHTIALCGVITWVMMLLIFFGSFLPNTEEITMQNFTEFFKSSLLAGLFFGFMASLLIIIGPRQIWVSPSAQKPSLFTFGFLNNNNPVKTTLLLNPISLPFFLSWKALSCLWSWHRN